MKKSNFACVYMQNISQYDSGERCGPWVFKSKDEYFESHYELISISMCS
jgi:hypothetical protein